MFWFETPGRLARAGAALALATALAAPAGLFLAGCGKVESTTLNPDGTVDESSIVLHLNAESLNVSPNSTVGLSINATDKNGFLVPDGTLVNLSQDPTLGVISPGTVPTQGGHANATFAAGAQEGTTMIRATYGKAVSEPLELKVVQGGGDGGGGGGGGGGADDILSRTMFLDGNPTDFDVNATLSNASVSGHRRVCLEFKKPHYTQEGKVDGNPWIFGNINGQWYAATFEWILAGQSGQCWNLEWEGSQPPFVQTERQPLSTWRPGDGEQIYFMISSLCRAGCRGGPRGRSNVVRSTFQ